jgi:carboxyl-terminal processing protease
VGQTSFGKGLVQSIIPLDFGAGLTLTSAKYYTPSGRLIQRDYSNGGFYDYYTHGGAGQQQQKPSSDKPSGQESRTDTGRAVYGGGGITPDESVDPRTTNLTQRRLLSPAFAFSRDLLNGRVKGFEANQLKGSSDYRHQLEADEFPISDSLFKTFKDFVVNDPTYRLSAAAVDRNRSFIELQLRFNIVTAAYGRVTGDRVFILSGDPQVAKAVDVVPKARDLAQTTVKSKAQP